MEKKPILVGKKSMLTRSPPESSLSTPVGKFASSLASCRNSSFSPQSAVCDSTKKNLSVSGASPGPTSEDSPQVRGQQPAPPPGTRQVRPGVERSSGGAAATGQGGQGDQTPTGHH
eukprot:GFUD01056945.1.p1 GENE.GFUD01056945.1~~GFUD01056945.1.p1  ORF type:complete len:133 (+),score=48.70 GFUD01056945.1:52-399(+)